MLALVVFILVVLVLFGGLIVVGMGTGQLDFNRRDRKAERRIQELENTLDGIMMTALENRSSDPILADIIIDEVRKAKRGELR